MYRVLSLHYTIYLLRLSRDGCRLLTVR